MRRIHFRLIISLAIVLLSAAPAIEAARNRPTRSTARTSVNSNNRANNRNANANRNRNTNVNRNQNINRNTNINRNVNVNVDRDVHVHGGYYGGGYYGGCCYNEHPVATAAAVTATAMVTAAVIGSVVNSVPAGCQTMMVNGIAYSQCGSTWYQPQISGGNTTYIVVNNPN